MKIVGGNLSDNIGAYDVIRDMPTRPRFPSGCTLVFVFVQGSSSEKGLLEYQIKDTFYDKCYTFPLKYF